MRRPGLWPHGPGRPLPGPRRVALAGLAAAVLLAGCGGHTATKADVIAPANAMCAATLRDIRGTPPPTGSGLTGLAAYARKVLPIIRREANELSTLPRPAKDRAVLNRYIAAVGAQAAAYRALATAAANGDPGGVATALGDLRSNPAQGLAAQYGLTQCAATAGTVR